MTKTTAPLSTPSPSQGVSSSKHTATGRPSPTKLFIGAALDMSWRLAIVVLLPVIGGFKLDEHYNTTPLITIGGFVVAMGGMALVVRNMLQQLVQSPVTNKEKQA